MTGVPVGLVVGGIGSSSGRFDQAELGAIVPMSLVTTVAGSRAFRHAAGALRAASPPPVPPAGPERRGARNRSPGSRGRPVAWEQPISSETKRPYWRVQRPARPRPAFLLAVVGAALLAAGAVAGTWSSRAAVSVAPASSPLAGPAAADFAVGEDGLAPAAVSLEWTASTANGFDNYTVKVSNASSSGPWSFAAAVTDEGEPTVVVANLGPGESYWWNVTAYATSAGILGIGAKTTETYGQVLKTTQPTLAYLTSPSNTSDSIELAWTNNATYTPTGTSGISFGSYTIEEIDDGVLHPYATITTESTESEDVTGLQSGHSYSFFVNTSDLCAGCTPGGASTTSSNTLTSGTATALTASIAATRTTVDAGLLTGFTCDPSGGTAPYGFAWNFTNGSAKFVNGTGTESHLFAYPTAAGYDVRCLVTDHAHDTFLTPPVNVVVSSPPKVTATVSALNVTEGASVDFRCTGSYGTDPLTVSWSLGDGAKIPGSGAYANGSASYGATGTYIAQCAVVDAVGVRATESFAVVVHPRPAYGWLTAPLGLLAGVGAGVVLAVAAAATRRSDEESERRSAMSRWIPPTGPASSVHGAKVCSKCGATNVPLRRTCEACGAPLPKAPEP